jgi:hypothetical protein
LGCRPTAQRGTGCRARWLRSAPVRAIAHEPAASWARNAQRGRRTRRVLRAFPREHWACRCRSCEAKSPAQRGCNRLNWRKHQPTSWLLQELQPQLLGDRASHRNVHWASSVLGRPKTWSI